MRTVGTIQLMRRGILTAAVAAVLSAGVPVSMAQVRQIQMGTSMDANPAVGSGGSNRPVPGYVQVNGNEVMTGNVSGLGSFHGAERQVAPGVFRSSIGTFNPSTFNGNLGSSSLSNFARQSAGGYQSGGAGLNQVYYLPSSTVSTGQGGLYSAPIGAGFDSAIVPRSAISPTASSAQINALQTNSYATPSSGLNRMATEPLKAGEPGAVLSNPLFILRTTAKTALPDNSLNGLKPGATTLPGTDINAGPDSEKPVNPAMVQGMVATGLVTGQTRDLKNAMVSDNYLKLSADLITAVGSTSDKEDATKQSPFPVPGVLATGQDIDPFTGQRRMIAKLQNPAATGPAQPTEPTRPAEAGVSARGLASASNSLLTAGSKVKPVKLAPENKGTAPLSSYDMTMSKAEQALKGSKYLDAAETYQAALGIKPEDPLALVGRAHAEFGAGLYTSAAHDLKFVFIRKPELVSVHYDVASFIPAARQEYLMEDLQKLTAKKESADSASFLYCYLCYQTGRNTALQTEMKKWGERNGHDEWQIVLTRAWMQKPAASEPAAAPAQPAAPAAEK